MSEACGALRMNKTRKSKSRAVKRTQSRPISAIQKTKNLSFKINKRKEQRFLSKPKIKKVFLPSKSRSWKSSSSKSRTRSNLSRSEERRVGKECRSRWSPYY